MPNVEFGEFYLVDVPVKNRFPDLSDRFPLTRESQ